MQNSLDGPGAVERQSEAARRTANSTKRKKRGNPGNAKHQVRPTWSAGPWCAHTWGSGGGAGRDRARGWPYSSAPIRLSHIHYPSAPPLTIRRYVSSPISHYPHCQIHTQSPQGSMGRKSRTTCNLTLTSRQVSFSSPTGGQVQQPAIIPTVDGGKGSSSILTTLILLHF